jgi:hypothetical protein
VSTAARLVAGVAVILALTMARLAPAGPAAAAGEPSLAGGNASGRGVFVTYSDRDTVIEGGTVAAPDASSPLVGAAVDLTGLGSALASFGYSPYSDAAGVVNAFGGTDLPIGALAEPSRAKVSGRPPQEQQIGMPGAAGNRGRARLAAGPTAEATTSAAGISASGVTVRLGDLLAVVERVKSTAGSTVSVVLRSVSIADVLTIDTIVLTATATADGSDGRSGASSVVEGVSVAGQPVRLTPEGFEPLGGGAPDLSALAGAGIEVLSAGEWVALPGGRQSDARATGPRLRFRSSDGRLVTVVLGEALASSTFVPASDG